MACEEVLDGVRQMRLPFRKCCCNSQTGETVNYYPHHIGDFYTSTRHLSRMERSVYRDMLDMYYYRETPLPADLGVLCRWVGASSEEERCAVEELLAEFFLLEADGWHQRRCDREIGKYVAARPAAEVRREQERERQRRAQAKRKALFEELALLGVTLPWNATVEQLQTALADAAITRDPTASITNPKNQEPKKEPIQEAAAACAAIPFPGALGDPAGETIHTKRKTKATKETSPVIATLQSVSDQVRSDWMELRRRKRAPITPTAVAGITREANKAGISLEDALRFSCEFGWGGFRAEWLANKINLTTNRNNLHEERAAVIATLTNHRPSHGRVVDLLPDGKSSSCVGAIARRVG